MKRVLFTLVVLSAFFLAVLPGMAHAAGSTSPANCPFVDKNDNGVFDGTDDHVTDAQWLNGAAFTTPFPFVVPPGCRADIPTVPSQLWGVMVKAPKITFLGTLSYLPAGGGGVAFIADPDQVPAPPPGFGPYTGSLAVGDGVTSQVRITAGGYTNLPQAPSYLNSLFGLTLGVYPAIPKKSVSLYAHGPCSVNNAEIIATRPFQDTMIGILCVDDVTIRSAVIIGSGVNIQSLADKIDAASGAGGTDNLAIYCDDPVINMQGGGAAPGNSNGILDNGDFPCQLDLTKVGTPLGVSPIFNNKTELEQYCKEPGVGRNLIQAHNDPLIMIAKLALDVHGVSSNKTDLAGRYRVVLASESGSIDTSNAHVYNYDKPTPPPGGAFIWLFAHPTSINRLTTEREDFFGPSGLGGATTNIAGACYQSPNPVQVGRVDGTMPIVGVPDPNPACFDFPADFVPILTKQF